MLTLGLLTYPEEHCDKPQQTLDVVRRGWAQWYQVPLVPGEIVDELFKFFFCRLFVCLRQSVCLSLFLSVCPSVCLSLCLSLSLCQSVCVCVSVSLSVSFCLSLDLSVCLSVSLYVCLSVCLSLSLCLPLSLCPGLITLGRLSS